MKTLDFENVRVYPTLKTHECRASLSEPGGAVTKVHQEKSCDSNIWKTCLSEMENTFSLQFLENFQVYKEREAPAELRSLVTLMTV